MTLCILSSSCSGSYAHTVLVWLAVIAKGLDNRQNCVLVMMAQLTYVALADALSNCIIGRRNNDRVRSLLALATPASGLHQSAATVTAISSSRAEWLGDALVRYANPDQSRRACRSAAVSAASSTCCSKCWTFAAFLDLLQMLLQALCRYM